MKQTIILLFCLCLLCGCSAEKQNSFKEKGNTMKVMVATDLHLLASEYHDGKSASQSIYNVRDGKMVQYGTEIIQAFVDTALAENADAVLLTGDLTFNGEKASHKELSELLQPLKEAGIHVVVLPGNHDIRNPYACSFKGETAYYEESIEAEEFAQIYAEYGYTDAESRDEHSLSYLYKISEDVWLLMIDASSYANNTEYFLDNSGCIKPETLIWMEECLRMAQQENAEVLMANHYYVLPNPHMEYMSDYQLQNAGSVMKLMSEYDVNVMFSGHTHAQSIMTREENGVQLADITTESLAVAEHMYGLVHVSAESFRYEAIPLDVEGWAKKQNLSDEQLLNFRDYGWRHFADISTALFGAVYESMGLEKETVNQMASLMGELNPYFFSGNVEALREELLESEAYRLLNMYGDAFSQLYLKTMIEPRAVSQRSIEMKLK